MSEASIKLKPEYFGGANLKVFVEGETVSLNVQVPDVAMKEIFEENFPVLKEHLEDAGIRIGEFTIDIQQNLFSFNEEKQQNIQISFNPSVVFEEEIVSQAIYVNRFEHNRINYLV
jgi:flagellar hook-length control protein FliK